jgi:hypothetical protein
MRYKSDDPKISDRKSSDFTSLASPHSIDSDFWLDPNELFFCLFLFFFLWLKIRNEEEKKEKIQITNSKSNYKRFYCSF